MFNRFVLTLIVLVLATFPAAAAARIALVISNAAYTSVGELANPLADAVAVTAALKAAGFDDVRHVTDLSAEKMRGELKEFSSRAGSAEIALIYYAGHGAELADENYLVPVDAKLLRSTDLQYEAISLSSVRAAVAGASKLRMVVLDACRNNPFKLASANGKRAATRGLSAIEPGAGEVVAYSAKEGTVAQDGPPTSNSPFAAALVKSLREPGLEIRLMFGRVRDDVLIATQNEQTPYTYASLGGEAIYLNPPRLLPQSTSLVAQEWQLVSSSNSASVIEAFRNKYATDALYSGLANERLALLQPNPTPKAITTFRDCAECPEMLVVPKGRYIMGAPANEPGFDAMEGPQHPVTISADFAVGKFEVTLAQFKAFAADSGHTPATSCLLWNGTTWKKQEDRSYLKPGFAITEKQPAVCLSWDDAKAYVDWLSSHTGGKYRLLTEAEWEYAARAGSTGAFVSGDQLSADQAKFESTTPAEVGGYAPNAFGLYDMLGNAWEWTQDCFSPNYDNASSDGSAFVAADCKRTYRGGGWANAMKDLRVASRGFNAPELHVDIFGLRVAKTLE